MSYLALYRKYRPQTFEDIVGQEHITTTLINQIKTGRVGHAYLFCGSRGTGKTTTARVFARAINCLSPKNGSPCGECEVCKALSKGEQFDIVEIDAASNNGVDDARALREAVKFMPVVGKKKVFIIDEVHMLSQSAFNALLKTLEEPPEHVVFIFGTTEIQKLPATILSRLMRFDFHLLSVKEIEEVLQRILKEDKIEADADAINMVARAGEGSMRDSISLLDSCLSYSPSHLTVKSVTSVLGTVGREDIIGLIASAAKGQVKEMVESLDGLLVGGKSPLVVSRELMSTLRDLLVVEALRDEAKSLVQADEVLFEKMLEASSSVGRAMLLKEVEALGGIEAELRQSVHPRLVLEMALFKVAGACLPEFSDVKNTASAPKAELSVALEVVKRNSQKNSGSVNILGELLQFLRSRGKMGLVAAAGEIESLTKVGNKLVAVCGDDAQQVLSSRKEEVLEFLVQHGCSGIEFQTKLQNVSSPVEELKRLFGSKLVVED